MKVKFKVILFSALRHATCANLGVFEQCIGSCNASSVDERVILADVTDCT